MIIIQLPLEPILFGIICTLCFYSFSGIHYCSPILYIKNWDTRAMSSHCISEQCLSLKLFLSYSLSCSLPLSLHRKIKMLIWYRAQKIEIRLDWWQWEGQVNSKLMTSARLQDPRREKLGRKDVDHLCSHDESGTTLTLPGGPYHFSDKSV